MSPVGHGKQAGSPGRGARHGEGSKSSGTAEGAGEEALRPSWALPRICHGSVFSSQGQSLAPQKRDDAREGLGSTLCTLSPESTDHINPEFPVPFMTLIGLAAPSHWDNLLFF